jgi:hypothetical protein
VGPYRIEDANALDDPFGARGLIPFDRVALGIPVHRANAREERLLLHGQRIPAPAPGVATLVQVLNPQGRFVAIARWDGGMLQPSTVFPPNPEQPPEADPGS